MSPTAGEPLQLWVRNDKGQVFGPLSPTSVELLLDNGVIQGRVQVSADGVNYVFPGRVPGVRMIFPRELWGEAIAPEDPRDAEWAHAALPPPLPDIAPESSASAPAHAAAPSTSSGIVAGPGARAAATSSGHRGPAPPPSLRAAAAPSSPSAVAPRPPAYAPSPSQAAFRLSPSQPAVVMPPSSPSQAAFRPSPSQAASQSSPSQAAVMPPSSPSQVGYQSSPSQVGYQSSPSQVGYQSSPSQAAYQSSPSQAAYQSSPSQAAYQSSPSQAAYQSSPSQVGYQSSPSQAAYIAPSTVPAAGDLSEHGPLDLYYMAASRGFTGRLILQLADRRFDLWFKRGAPQLAESTHPDDGLDAFLIRERLAQPAQLAKAMAARGQYGGELLTALFATGALNPNVVLPRLVERAQALFGHALLAEHGTFSWAGEELPAQRAMPLGDRWALYLGQLRNVPHFEVQRRLQDAMQLPVMRSGGLVPVDAVRLQPKEARALTFFDGVRSLAQLVVAEPTEAAELLTTAWMLRPLELVAFAGVAAAQPTYAAPPPVAAPQAPVPPAAPPVTRPPTGPSPAVPHAAPPVMRPPSGSSPPVPPAAPPVMRPPTGSSPPVMRPPTRPVHAVAPAAPVPASVAAEVKQLADLLAAMKKKTYFEVLGLDRNAEGGVVKMAYFKLAKSYHPDTVAPGSPEALVKAKADVFALVGEAHRVLADPALRSDYMAELDAGGTGEKVDVSKIFLAEELFQKGSIMVKARKYADGLKMLDEAIAANPDEGEYYAWRGFARFFGFPERKQGRTEAMKDIDKGLKMNPNIAAAHFFIGIMAKLTGDNATAKKAFARCVELNPQHIDAQRELRMMK